MKQSELDAAIKVVAEVQYAFEKTQVALTMAHELFNKIAEVSGNEAEFLLPYQVRFLTAHKNFCKSIASGVDIIDACGNAFEELYEELDAELKKHREIRARILGRFTPTQQSKTA